MYTPSETLRAALAAGNPQRVLLEFTDPDTGETETFSNEDIDISDGLHTNRPFNGDEELTVGLCPSAEVRFTLLNDQRQLADFRFGECAVWIGARIDEGTPGSGAKTATFTEDGEDRTYEFIPIGVFIVERPDIVQRDVIQITANDRMGLFDKEMPSRTDLGLNPTSANPATILQLLQAMCQNVGVSLASTSFLNNNLQFTSWPTKYFENRTMREVLKWIAEAAGSIALFNRYGELEITWFNDLTQDVAYDENNYSDFVQTWYEVEQIDGLKVRNQDETSESTVGTDPDNPYVIAGNPFLS